MITQLEIAVQSTYDTNTGSGPIASALNWECATRLNKVGAFSFEMPLADSKRSLLVAKRYVRCYGIVNDAWTEQGKPGIIERISRSIDGEGVPTGMIRVEGTDLFGELNDILIHELDIINTSTRIPDSVQYFDGTGGIGFIDMSNAYDDNPATSVEIPADDEDWFYIGDADPWDITIFDLGANLNSDSNNFTVQYSQGASAWASGTILSDTTKVDNASFAQDGAIRWERQEDWATDTVNSIADMYWLRFRYGEDMSGDVTVIEIDITQEIPTATALTLWQEYEDVDGNTPISTLGWDFEATHTETQNTVFLKLREVSAFKALAMIAEQTGENFRLGSGREIEWLQDDKTASGIVATNAIDATAGASATTNCWITSFRQSSDAYELVGRVYPRGGGRGATRINLLECTRTAAGGYTLSKSLNYLQKDSVESDYGRPIERPKYWPELMSPNAANAKDINVANALYDLTYQYLQRHCIPQTAYDLEVVKLDSAVPVGTTLQVAYWQTVDGSAIMDVGVDGTAVHLWVLESTQRVSNDGLRSVAMKIATTDAWPTSPSAKMQEVVYQVLAIQATDGPMSAASLTVGTAADLLGSLDLSAYYKKPTNTTVVLGLDAGNVPPASNHGVFVGNEAGYSSTSGQDNTFLGYRSGRAATTGYDNTMVGSDAMRLGLGTANTGVGYRVLENVGKTTDGLYNTAVGHQAGRAIDEGDENVAIGGDALSLGDPSMCVAVGYAALENAGTTSDGDGNTAVGQTSLQEMDEGHYNVAVGYNSMGANTEGDHNTAIGDQAMYEGAGSYNIAIGRACLHATTAVNGYNIAIGDNALYNLTSGVGNIAIGGAETMMYSTTGNYNVIIGHEAGVGASPNTFANNVIMGYQGGYALRTGGNNVLIGHQAGLALTGGSNVFIGYLAGSQAVGVSNQLYIENSNSATPLIYGEFDNDLVRINGDLDVTGNVAMATTKFIGITGNEIITFQAAGTIDFTGADVTMSNDLTVTNDIILLDGSVVGIAGNEIITFNAAGTIAVTGADVLLGSEDGLGKLNFDEGTTIATGIVWGSDANKVTLYRSADDMLKTDDSLTVALKLNVGASLALSTTVAALEIPSALTDVDQTNSAIFFSGVQNANQNVTIGFGNNPLNDTNALIAFDSVAGWRSNIHFFVNDAGAQQTLAQVLAAGVGLTVGNQGYVGVGNPAPGQRLDVLENRAGQFAATFKNDGDNNDRYGISIVCGKDDASGDNQVLWAFDGDVTIEGYLTIDDGVFELNQGSDMRRKKELMLTDSVLDRLRKVEIMDFSWRDKAPGVRHTGFVAQQLHEHLPMIGKYNEETDWWGVVVTRMIPINTKAIQEVDIALSSYSLNADAEREAIRARLDSIERRG